MAILLQMVTTVCQIAIQIIVLAIAGHLGPIELASIAMSNTVSTALLYHFLVQILGFINYVFPASCFIVMFHSNGPVIWHALSDITHILAASLLF